MPLQLVDFERRFDGGDTCHCQSRGGRLTQIRQQGCRFASVYTGLSQREYLPERLERAFG